MADTDSLERIRKALETQAPTHPGVAVCDKADLRSLLAREAALRADAERWRLIAAHWKDAQMRWKKEPNVPRGITITVDFGVVAAEAAQIEGFLDCARAALASTEPTKETP